MGHLEEQQADSLLHVMAELSGVQIPPVAVQESCLAQGWGSTWPRKQAKAGAGGWGQREKKHPANTHTPWQQAGVWLPLTVHVDLLRQFDQLHLGGHVTHGPHAIPQVSAVDVAISVSVKLFEGFSQLCGGKCR